MVGPAARQRRREELERLKAEAATARAELDGTVACIRREVHDPYGIRTAITSHPFVTAAVATGVGVGAAKLFGGRTSKKPDAPTRLEYWAGRMLDALLHTLKPLATVYLQRWVQDFAQTPVQERAAPA